MFCTLRPFFFGVTRMGSSTKETWCLAILVECWDPDGREEMAEKHGMYTYKCVTETDKVLHVKGYHGELDVVKQSGGSALITKGICT